ncbi:MAG TPA: tRNA (adenosine(37)-N6)-dimethylallyltransferase MiaA, partial [Bacteroidales bacterium]|nr:tRNA (adenosine(37)-N6)-dimethylallyltransferase MiaA [Bacteroidales bacterium]
TGPTAVGKTSVSVALAKQLSTSVLSADSRQFYREMRIGTATPKPEELDNVPHYFIGNLSVNEDYNASRFEEEALKLLEKLFSLNNKTVILTGGSGLYINALCRGIDDLPDPDLSLREKLKEYLEKGGTLALGEMLKAKDPAYYEEVDKANPKRLLRALEVCLTTGKPYSSFRRNKTKDRFFKVVKIGLYREREELNNRINQRVDHMMEEGLLEEVRSLVPYRHLNALNTVGYKELFRYLDGVISLDQAVTDIKTNSRRYAKRQMTWFRKDQEIHWADANNLTLIRSLCGLR